MSNKFYDIVKQAYESDELLLLLSADEKYINGNEWLKPNSRLSMGLDADPINEFSLFSSIVNLYLDTKDTNVKQAFKNACLQMLAGTEKQVYFATELFYALADDALEDKYHPFEDIYKELALIFTAFISENLEKLKAIKIYNCKDKDEGLYKLCEYYSNEIVEMGGKPIVVG